MPSHISKWLKTITSPFFSPGFPHLLLHCQRNIWKPLPCFLPICLLRLRSAGECVSLRCAHDKTISGGAVCKAEIDSRQAPAAGAGWSHSRSLTHVSLLRDAVQTAARAQRPLDRRPQPAELVAGKTLFATLFGQQQCPQQQQLQDAAWRQPGV